MSLAPRSGASTRAVNDLKAWMLFGETETRHFDFWPSPKRHEYRSYGREEVFEQYLRTLLSTLPPERLEGRLWLLMPSIQDNERRRRYRDALERAVPGALVVPEPEMIIEYFRLVRRELHLKPGRTGIFLVVDAGASTCNFTFVLTRNDETVIDSTSGRQRETRLRAVRGDAAGIAGSWVDQRIAQRLGLDLRGFEPSIREDILRSVETAKIDVGRRAGPATIQHSALAGPAELNREILVSISTDFWEEVSSVYLDTARRLLEQMRSTTHARDQFAPLLESRHVREASDVQHLIDAVLLAGGSTLLPDFEHAMRERIFPDADELDVLQVGDDYPIAASVGALAHVLDQNYAPSRLHGPPTETSNLAAAKFHGTLPTDVYLAWKHLRKATPGPVEQALLVLDRDDPFVETGGDRRIEGLPRFNKGTRLGMRLVPGPGISRRGLQPVNTTVKREPVTIHLAWSPNTQEARVRSAELENLGSLFMSVSSLGAQGERAPTAGHTPKTRIDTLTTDGAPDVVIDLGMSKTVIVSAEAGPFHLPRGLGDALPPAADDDFGSGERADSDHTKLQGSGGTEAHLVSVSSRSPSSNDDPSTFGARLEKVLLETPHQGLRDAGSDLAMLFLALSVRPFVMIAGPPGSGKSTLVRTAARLLGLAPPYFVEVAVQPHWRTAKALPQNVREAYDGTTPNLRPGLRMFLFDEFNLTRPENYLMPFFAAIDDPGSEGERLIACGTLNIDDASRPPSPKVVDRCFFMEVDAPKVEIGRGKRGIGHLDLGAVGVLPDRTGWKPPETDAHKTIREVVETMRECVRTNNLRQDLLPSYRAIADVEDVLALHQFTGMPESLLSAEDLLDRALAGRLLVKLGGAAEQVKPLIDALFKVLSKSSYERCLRRIQLARTQLDLGFVSPWQ